MRTVPFLVLSLPLFALVSSGCEQLMGPFPFHNDPPVIERFGDVSFVNAKGEVTNTYAEIRVPVGTHREFELVATEPENQPITYSVGPLPRGWSYDTKQHRLKASPDHKQRGLTFQVYLVAEDNADLPAYDVRIIDFVPE